MVGGLHTGFALKGGLCESDAAKNCPRCTMLSDTKINGKLCEACGYNIATDFFKDVSATEGDTTYVGRDTERCIQNALATLEEAVDHVTSTGGDAFALIRPPGHHCGESGNP